jgi:hypothetical protein
VPTFLLSQWNGAAFLLFHPSPTYSRPTMSPPPTCSPTCSYQPRGASPAPVAAPLYAGGHSNQRGTKASRGPWPPGPPGSTPVSANSYNGAVCVSRVAINIPRPFRTVGIYSGITAEYFNSQVVCKRPTMGACQKCSLTAKRCSRLGDRGYYVYSNAVKFCCSQ